MYDRKPQNSVKQLSFIKKLNLKKLKKKKKKSGWGLDNVSPMKVKDLITSVLRICQQSGLCKQKTWKGECIFSGHLLASEDSEQ